jgi:hypothetical protein
MSATRRISIVSAFGGFLIALELFGISALNRAMKQFAAGMGTISQRAGDVLDAVAHAENPKWKTFSNRAGWRIKYPVDWKIANCKSCKDPSAPDVSVDFLPPADRDSGWVIIEHLADKPPGTDLAAWFTQIKRTANLNDGLTEQSLTLNGRRALKVRYRDLQAHTPEVETVYLVSGSQTFAIEFGGDRPGLPLEKVGNYHTFLQMVDSFAVRP